MKLSSYADDLRALEEMLVASVVGVFPLDLERLDLEERLEANVLHLGLGH